MVELAIETPTAHLGHRCEAFFFSSHSDSMLSGTNKMLQNQFSL